MPKPLKSAKGLNFDSKSPLRMPKLGAHIATISAIASTIDMMLATMLAAFMGAEAGVGMVIYNSLENEGSKMAILRTMAERFLDADGMVKFNKLLKDVRERRPDRNNVAHGMWGYAADHPDGLVWIDPRDLQTYMAKITVNVAARGGNVPLPPWDKALVYEEQDFIEIEARLDALHRKVADFYAVLVAHVAQKAGP